MAKLVTKKKSAPFCFGPSHAVRWQWHVRDKVVRCAMPSSQIFGLGGAPIWSKTLFDKACSAVDCGADIRVMVGDFRFGNSIALQEAAPPPGMMQDGHLGVDRKAMTPAHDQEMLARGMAALRRWHQSFGSKARYIFWDLFGKQVHDRIAGRHIIERRYRHPVFNYHDVVASLPELDIVDLAPLLRLPMHEVTRLFIDSSAHPSQIGYLLLDNLLCEGLGAADAYQHAVTEFEAELFALARRVAAAKGGKLVLTGRSVCLDTLMRYLGARGAVRLAEAGLIVVPLDHVAGQPPPAEMAKSIRIGECAVIVLSADGGDLAPILARTFGTTAAAWANVTYIDWESACKPTIIARTETPRFVHSRAGRPGAAQLVPLGLAPHMVEQGPLGMPSWTGLRHVLRQIGSDSVPTTRPDVELARDQPRPPGPTRHLG